MMTKEKLKTEIVDAITVKGEICVNDIVKICRRNHARWRGTQRIAVTGYPNALLLVDNKKARKRVSVRKRLREKQQLLHGGIEKQRLLEKA